MPKLYQLFILLCFTNLCLAQGQSTWHLTVVDSATNKGIAKVTLSLNNKFYYTSNNNGLITIDKNNIHKKDNIVISCIGYKSVNIAITGNDKYPDTVRLSTAAIALKEVEIKPSEEIELNVKDNKKRVHYTHRLTSPACSYVQFIPNKSNIKGTIISIQYNINDRLHGIERPFRVRLFTKMKDSITLDKELTTDSIIVYNPQRKKMIDVDVSKYNIQMPENGVLIVFETLDSSHYKIDTVPNNGYNYAETPGIDMIQTKNYWEPDYDKINRLTPYSMDGPPADRWNNGGLWYVYKEGNNFAISITVSPD